MNRQRGFTLLELVIVMAVILILATMSLPSFVQITASRNTALAKARVIQFANAQAALALCAITINCVPPVGVTALIPIPGNAVQQSGYSFTYTLAGGGWTYVAVPIAPALGNNSFYVDQTGIVRCAANVGGIPC